MKKCILVILAVLFLAACGNGGDYTPTVADEPPPPPFIGRWELMLVENLDGSITPRDALVFQEFFEFSADGTGQVEQIVHTMGQDFLATFTWTTERGYLYFVPDNPEGTATIFTYQMDGANGMTLFFPDGGLWVLRRPIE